MSSAAAILITSPTKTERIRRKSGKSANNSGAANLGSDTGAAGGGTPLTGTVTSWKPGGNRPVLITDRFELFHRQECDAVAKLAANVKNVQPSGIENTALSMIANDLHKTIGQKFSVLKHHHGLDPKDWKAWPCKILTSTL